jgi:type IV pilus assembly protein PilW
MTGGCGNRPSVTTAAGTTLVELLVAIVIAALVIAGAGAAAIRVRSLGSIVESDAQLQESARYALAILASDVRMAGFWGLTTDAKTVSVDPSLTFPSRCGGPSWVTGASEYVAGSNNSYLQVPDCDALAGGPASGADVLVVRRASARRLAPQRPVIAPEDQTRVLIVTSHEAGTIFVPRNLGNSIPAGFATSDPPGEPPRADTRALSVNAYYVSMNSSVGRGFPALRRKTLTAGPDIGDEEVIAGVEDLQFQLGVYGNGDSAVDQYVEPGAVPPGARPVSVRIWLRLRARDREPGFLDDQEASYADRRIAAPNDSFRRLLVTETIRIRNAPQ